MKYIKTEYQFVKIVFFILNQRERAKIVVVL